MFLRLVDGVVKKDGDFWLEQVYADTIMQALEKTPGCIFAGLMYSLDQTNRYISLTLWATEEDAKRYVESGEYQKNIDLVLPMLEKSSEWKIQLSRDNTIEYTPVQEDISVKSYSVSRQGEPLPDEIPLKRTFLRILSLKINKGHEKEFTDIYDNEILPELLKVNGCRNAFLIDNTEKENEMISFSIWDDESSVRHYEEEGKFKEFLKKVSHTLGDLYQWKMSLEDTSDSTTTVTSQDIGVSKFTLVTGKKFR